jgi:uncharacterized membrane protein
VTAPILYCGDTCLDGDAAYLAGMLTLWGFAFDYCPSDRSINAAQIANRRLVILSDYPSAQLNAESQAKLLDAVSAGTSLLMIGGWESFHGLGGDWDTTSIANALPVVVDTKDDRMNCDHPVVIRQKTEHAVVNGLPWLQRAPYVGGFNRFVPRDNSTVVLEADRLRPRHLDGTWRLELVETHPMLVAGSYGAGKTAALATDGAPHWVGGFVDWGDQRVTAKATGSRLVEVGDLYAKFWQQLFAFMAK